MVLHPLEFSECFLDSPWFRQSIKEYEDELERTNTQIKQLIKDAKAMLQACRKQGETMQTFSERLKNFQFDIIGENLTDDERGIAGSLKEFGSMLEEIEAEWSRTIQRSELQLIEPLEKFRKDHIHSYRENKKLFDKSGDRYYKQMEQTLALSHKKKEQQLLDADNELVRQKKDFHKVSLNYVYKLQEVQERKKFEFVEHLLMFMQVYFNFFHQTHEVAIDCKEYMGDIQMRLVGTRSQYEGTRDKTQMLMKKMMDDPSVSTKKNSENTSPQRVVGQRWARAGYLLMSEKNPLVSRFAAKWPRYFCMYTKENKLFQMLPPFNHSSSSSSNASSKIATLNHHGTVAIAVDPLIVLTCTRKATDSIDKRFCFDIEVEDSAGKQSTLTLQATSNNDRKKWLAAMDGKEPNYIQTHEYKKPEEFALNETSIKFVKDVIEEIERRGIDAEGIYRLVGVSSKVDKLLQIVMDPSTFRKLNYQDESEWELNTLTSALKNFFRNLPEPIMTFDLHEDFIAAAKQQDPDERLNRVINLVKKLSSDSHLVLEILIRHLHKVSSMWQTNKMTAQNIGVCFGPTLMRPKQETVQSIMEIKFNNIIVEILIENYAAIFDRHDVEERKAVSPKPVDSRPSLRYKSRPMPAKRKIVAKNVVLEEEAANLLQPAPDASTRFQRGHAIRGVPGKPLSPRSQRRIVEVKPHSEHDEESLSSSDNNTDEFGRISPLDLNLGLDHFSLNHSPSPGYTNLQPKTQPIHPPMEERVKRENWQIDRKLARKTSASGGRAFKKSTVGSKSERSRSPSGAYNLNQNNSKPPPERTTSPSVKHRKEQLMNSVAKNKPPLSSKSTIKRRVSPLQGSRPDVDADHSNKPQRPTGIVDFDKLKGKFSPHEDDKIFSIVAKTTPDSAGDHSLSFLWPKMGSLKSNSYVEANSSVEQRPRSTVLSSREVFPKNLINLNSPTSPTDAEKSPPVGSPVSPTGKHAPSKAKEYISLYACEAENDSELSFERGIIISDVKESEEPGWLVGTLDGVTGLIPENYVREKIWD